MYLKRHTEEIIRALCRGERPVDIKKRLKLSQHHFDEQLHTCAMPRPWNKRTYVRDAEAILFNLERCIKYSKKLDKLREECDAGYLYIPDGIGNA
jgi:hypothetical protein